MESENILNWLRDSPAFQGAPPEALQELAEGFEPRTIEPGEVVVSEGDSGGEFFMLAEGSLTVASEKNGEQRYLGNISAGDTFGEIASLTGGRRLATVTAAERGLLLVLSGAEFQSVLHRHPPLAESVLRSLERYLEP